MKRFFILLSCLTLVVTLGGHRAEAGAGGGGATEVTQLANNLQLIPINISDAVTAFATEADFVFNTILGPIANGLIAVALQTMSSSVLSWVNGGLGDGPSLIQDPLSFMQKEGLIKVENALSAIPEDSLFGNTVFSSILEGTQYQTKDTADKIKDLLKSDIPATVQNNICSDDRLTALAKERAGDNADNDTIQVEREYLYGYACSCDPSQDTDCSTKLMDLYTQRPDLGGNTAWLSLIKGNNEFTKVTLARELVGQDVLKAEDLATKELFDGLGTVSETKCLEEKQNVGGGTFCAIKSVLTPGDAVQNALNIGSTAGLQRMLNIQGEGALTSLLTGFLQESLFKGLNKGLVSLTGGNNTSQTTNSTAPAAQDLASDPSRKTELIGTLMKQIDFTTKTLDDLQRVDADYLYAINAYQGRINQVKSCFDNLLDRNMTTMGDPRVSNAYAFYNNRKGRIDATRAILNDDATKISTARQYVTAVTTQLSASNSSEEISGIFNDYMKNYSEQNLPTNTTFSLRKQSYSQDISQVETETEDDTHLSNCAAVEADYYRSQQTY